jgi:hypothetical protein
MFSRLTGGWDLDFRILALRESNGCEDQHVNRTARRIFISGFVVFQLATFFAIGYFAVQTWMWKTQALDAIAQNGANDAIRDYRKGMRQLLEVKRIDDSSRDYSGHSFSLYEKIPANRQEGAFAVWHVVIPSASFAEQAAAYIKSYNGQMRIRIEKPEWFTPEGERKPRERNKSKEPAANDTRGNV